MDDFSTLGNQSSKSKSKKFQRPQNFIEALKDLGSSVKSQAKDATVGMGRGAVDQLFGATDNAVAAGQAKSADNQASKPFSFEDFLKSRERQVEVATKQKYEQKIQQERLIFHQKEEQAKQQIKVIQEELKKLADSTSGLSQEVKKAVFTGIAEAGTYHVSFFARLRSIIELARQEVASSVTWLRSSGKRRKQQQGFYWNQVKKSGTRYMLSQERYMSTQGG
jgi:hypothetical protein